MLTARFDGACWPNPLGKASAACLIERDGKEIYRAAVYLGEGQGMTNNVAEFAGLRLILEYLTYHPEDCLVISDSRIVVNRMSRFGGYGSGACKPWAEKCKKLVKAIPTKIHYRWESRMLNEVCDAMCREVLQHERAIA